MKSSGFLLGGTVAVLTTMTVGTSMAARQPAPRFEDVGEPRGSCVDSMEPLKPCHHGYQGPKVDLESLNWRKLNGPFVSVWLHNVPWGAENTMAAPDAKFGDGYLDLIVMRHCPKLALISLMSELDNGGHVKSPYVVYIKVKAVILEPGSRMDEPIKEGIIDSDGEVLARGKGTYKPKILDGVQEAASGGGPSRF